LLQPHTSNAAPTASESSSESSSPPPLRNLSGSILTRLEATSRDDRPVLVHRNGNGRSSVWPGSGSTHTCPRSRHLRADRTPTRFTDDRVADAGDAGPVCDPVALIDREWLGWPLAGRLRRALAGRVFTTPEQGKAADSEECKTNAHSLLTVRR
jgi:hypothetical protein